VIWVGRRTTHDGSDPDLVPFEHSKWQTALAAIVAASVIAAVGVRLLGAQQHVLLVASPALVVAAWVSFGHLITIDEDLAGGLANPDDDPRVSRTSLVQLCAKFGVAAAIVLIVVLLLAL